MWLWLGAAALFLLMEMATGTFYLLLVALGFAASGAAAYLGTTPVIQLVSGMVVALLGLALLHRYRKSKGYTATESDADVVPDIGKRVMVDAWNAHRAAKVFYRGANWTALLDEGEPMLSGEHYIHAVRGLTLILRRGDGSTATPPND